MLSGSIVFTFTILKEKTPGGMVLSRDDECTISVRYFKFTLTIKCAPQQIKKAKQKCIQAVNPELTHVLGNWGSSRR